MPLDSYQQSVLPLIPKNKQIFKEAIINADMVGKDYTLQLLEFARAFQQFIAFDFIEFSRNNRTDQPVPWCSFLRIGSHEYQPIDSKALTAITTLKINLLNELRQRSPTEVLPVFLNGPEFSASLSNDPIKSLYAQTFKLRSNLVFPLLLDDGAPFIVSFFSTCANAYDATSLEMFGDVQYQFACTLRRVICNVNHGHPPPKRSFRALLGESRAMAETLNIVKHLAAVDTTVLILGETGTGKERIAQEIHYLSSRFDKAFVKVNCAALPSGLMESELFGHEKGAFTGAISSRAGRLEQANGGTIFLDEVGEIPLVAQSMLLRFLQEKEIQPIGGERTVNLDVRIIAATNKDLYDAVRKGEFRMDLYYRLNVFPITLPPLRERPEDIPILVRHFVRLYSLRHRKQISQITPAALNNLSDYCWPGNVRELENCMERTIVLTSGSIIDKIFLHPTPLLEVGKKGTIKTLAEIEKAYIQEVLAQARNRISGARGAAAMLNLPTSTLISRMKKLGLKK